MTQTLIAMRADEMTRVHPQTDFSQNCSKCGKAVGIFPSGQAVIAKFGLKKVAIICNHCVKPEEVAGGKFAPGALKEIKESIPRPSTEKEQ